VIDTVERIVAEMRNEARAERLVAPLLASRLDEYADRIDDANTTIHDALAKLYEQIAALHHDISHQMRGPFP
jgi:phosphoglycerate-specific signal transduction histidine kinase